MITYDAGSINGTVEVSCGTIKLGYLTPKFSIVNSVPTITGWASNLYGIFGNEDFDTFNEAVASLVLGSVGKILPEPKYTITDKDKTFLHTMFREMMDCGEKINAIKIWRSLSGMGLKEAKDYVEALRY